MPLLRLAAAAALLVVASSPAAAQLPREFRVNTYTTELQLYPSVAMGPDGRFVIFWGSDQDGSSHGVYGQRYTRSGRRAGREFRVNDFTTFMQTGPSAAAGADGTFIVTWQSEPQDGDRFAVFARRYTANGVRIGGEFQVNTYTTNRQAGPRVASGADGRFVVVWTSFDQDGSWWGVFGQRFAPDATPLGGEFRVNDFTLDYQMLPSVAVGPDGGFVVAWDSFLQDGSAYGVFARRYDAAGAAQGGEFQVNTHTTEFQRRPAVAYAPDGTFVIAWDSFGQDGELYGVFARRFSASGQPLGPERLLNAHTASSQAGPALAFAADGRYLVTWQSWDQDGSQWGVYARWFSPTDDPLTGEFQISRFTPLTQATPDLAMLPDGRYVVTWISDTQDGSRFGIYGRRFYPSPPR